MEDLGRSLLLVGGRLVLIGHICYSFRDAVRTRGQMVYLNADMRTINRLRVTVAFNEGQSEVTSWFSGEPGGAHAFVQT